MSAGLTVKELAEMAQARSHVYNYLAEFYLRSPEEEGFADLLQEDVVGVLPEVFGSSRTVNSLVNYLYRLKQNPVHLNKAILDYHNLFTVPGSFYVAPYESCYREPAADGTIGRVWGETTLQVRSLYCQSGARFTGASRELPDHVGVELQFLGLLCAQEARAWEKEDRSRACKVLAWEAGFIQDHLIMWLPALCKRMAKMARTVLYRGIAGLTPDFLEKDLKFVLKLLAS